MALSDALINIFARVVKRKAEDSGDDYETVINKNYTGLQDDDVDAILNKLNSDDSE